MDVARLGHYTGALMARAVVVAGKRTPFNKAFGPMRELDTIALGVQTVRALLEATSLSPSQLDSIVWGGVILPPHSPNVGREIALDLRLPLVEAMTVTRACASGLSAITTAALAIERGETDIAVAGGSDSTSNVPITLPSRFIQRMGPVAMGKRASPMEMLSALAQLNLLNDILPKFPKVAERTTGETMGQSCEKMADRNGITRQAQDEFALQSHLRAARAIESGRFQREVIALKAADGTLLSGDGIVRGDTTMEKLGKLRPAFRKDGTITAGNASPLTDGAAAVLLMSEEKARSLGYTPLCTIKSTANIAVDPLDQLLIGPALAIPKALERAGLTLQQMDLVDLHEAFAAQVLSVQKALGSQAFARERLGKDKAVGELDPNTLNVHGGSISIGHPFGATGARMVTTMANELVERDKTFALLGVCAAGGLGAAAVLERLG
jgi:acetyl-CoA acyltransferase